MNTSIQDDDAELDETIKMENALADSELKNAEFFDLGEESSELFKDRYLKCQKAAERHRKLAQWLDELKSLRKERASWTIV